jgi:RNA polymerase sigma factor (sigma-70 family)
MTELETKDALAILSDNQRRVIVLRHIEGRAIKDTADQMGLSKTRVTEIEKKALHKIKTHLRKEDVLLPLTAKRKA